MVTLAAIGVTAGSSMTNPTAHNGLRDILTESWDQHGFTCPLLVREYIVKILAEKIDQNPWQPEPSYAERYMTLRTPSQALDLGNTCFFTRSVFPDIGTRRGIRATYYTDIGQGAYDFVLSYSAIPAVRILRDHFEYCAEMTWTAVHSKDAIREFWDL